MKITKANGKSEYALIESLKKRSGETDQKIVDIVTSKIGRAEMMLFVNILQDLMVLCLKRQLLKRTSFYPILI